MTQQRTALKSCKRNRKLADGFSRRFLPFLERKQTDELFINEVVYLGNQKLWTWMSLFSKTCRFSWLEMIRNVCVIFNKIPLNRIIQGSWGIFFVERDIIAHRQLPSQRAEKRWCDQLAFSHNGIMQPWKNLMMKQSTLRVPDQQIVLITYLLTGQNTSKLDPSLIHVEWWRIFILTVTYNRFQYSISRANDENMLPKDSYPNSLTCTHDPPGNV